MKLEIKHIAAYLPYGVKCRVLREDGSRDDVTLTPKQIVLWEEGYHFEFRLHLRPLTGNELTTPISHAGMIFEPMAQLEEMVDTDAERDFLDLVFGGDKIRAEKIKYCPCTIAQHLLEWHFDIYGLLPAGLAIPLTDSTANQPEI